jgi:hypothetical protein
VQFGRQVARRNAGAFRVPRPSLRGWL